MDYEKLLLEHLDLVDRVVRHVARKHHLSASDADEFAGVVRFRLVDRDYAILRKFQGRSNLGTYLTTVIERLFLDYCISQWGKWRPSAIARRIGPHAVLLERLLSRDGMTFDEAVSTLQTNHRCPATREELHGIFVQLPTRIVRRLAGDEELAAVAQRAAATDGLLDRNEEEQIAERIDGALLQAIAALTTRDRLILKLRFEQDMRMADIARLVDTPVNSLYRDLGTLVAGLHERLRQQGIDRTDVDRVVGNPAVTLGRALQTAGEPDGGSV